MNVLNKLTKRNLTLNKKRTIVTIIGIMLSTALIVCVSGMVTSFQKTLINRSIEEDGYYHVVIKDMKKEDVLALAKNRDIKDYYISNEVGYAPFSSTNMFKPYLYITAYNEKALHNLGITLIEGRLPENPNEIMIPNHAMEGGGFTGKIGDTLTLQIGNRVLEDEGKTFILNQNNPLVTETEENAIIPQEKVIESFGKIGEKTYTIVGIMERPNYDIESYAAPGYTCITYTDEIKEKTNAFVLFKDAKGYDDKTKNIVGEKYDYRYNSSYLRWLGVTDSETMNALYIVAAIVITIIIVSSVFVIKNSFAISITEKYKMYGMLRSVGATSKQIKKNVLFEGFFLGLIAIPIGIVCGVLAIVILVFLINLIIGDYLNGIKFVYSIPILPILLSIVLASITIYLSTIFIAKKAGKISAIEAIRSNNDIKIKSKKLKTPRIVKSLFKTGGVIAYKNLKRNKKKYRTTVVSIVVSIFVFLSLSSFIQFGFKMAGMYYVNMDYNMSVYSNVETKQDKMESFQEIANFDVVDRYSIVRMDMLQVDKKQFSDYGKEIMKLYGMDVDASNRNEEDYTIGVVALGEQEYNRYLKKIGVSRDKPVGILLDEFKDTINKKNYVGNLYNLKNNDTFEGVKNEEGQEEPFQIEIVRSEERPMGLERSYSFGGYLIVSDEIFDTHFEDLHPYMYVQAKDTKKLEEQIDTLSKEKEGFKGIGYTNYEEEVKAENAMVLIISIFLYGFITVISLIGITNIFNTITTNMNLRSKEFAMLKSVGMTNREFNRMIRLESIFYGMKSLLIGIPLGLLGSYAIYLAFKEGLEFSYALPIQSLVIVILFVSIIIGIIMKYSLSKINKQNIIETIRNDNI